MKLILFLFLTMFQLGVISCSRKCSDSDERQLMGSWYKKKIVLPGDWQLLDSSTVRSDLLVRLDSPDAKYYVLHYFMADCDKCINELFLAQKFIRKNEGKFPNVKFVFVGTGASNIYLKEAMQKANFDYPLYFEKRSFRFKIMNKFPLEDRLYDTMLMNSDNQVVLFGAVFNNDRAEGLFKEIVNRSCN